MSEGQSRAPAPGKESADALRMRVLEYQVKFLRRELEFVNERHAKTIYSAAWHLAWPARKLEQAIRAAHRRYHQSAGKLRASRETMKVPVRESFPTAISADAGIDAKTLVDRISSRMKARR